MPQTTTPARVQWPRFSASGDTPSVMAPGSLAINWEDKKIIVGDAGGLPVTFSQWLEDWSADKIYKAGDLALVNGEIWRSRVPVPSGGNFVPGQWEQLTEAGRAAASEPFITGVLQGGLPSLEGGLVSVVGGSGLLVNNTDPEAVSSVVANWTAFIFAPTDLGTRTTAFGINSSGRVSEISLLDPDIATWRRDTIALGHITWADGNPVALSDVSIRAAGTAEAFRDAFYATGGACIAQGCYVLQRSEVPSMELARAAGTVFSLFSGWRNRPRDPHLNSVPVLSPVSFVYTTRDGPVTGTPTTFIDPSQADVGGVLTPVGSTEATIQYLYMDPQDPSIMYMEYGQIIHASEDGARLRLSLDYVSVTPFSDRLAFVLMAAIVVRGGATEVTQTDILQALKGGRPFSYYNPLIGRTDGAYLVDGSRPLSGDMDASGFRINDAVIDGGTINAPTAQDTKVRVGRSAVTGEIAAGTSGADEGEISANLVDQKLYVRNDAGVPLLIGAPLLQYRSDRVYYTNDTVIHDDVLYYRTGTASLPGVFDPAGWQAVSVASAVTDAVALAPDQPGRNTVVTENDTEGLIIEGQQLQTAPLLHIPGTTAGDSGAATVDRYGFPVGHFAPQVFRVVVPSHEFQYRGEVAEYNAAVGWRLARGTDSNVVPLAVIDQVIDANTVVLRTGGVIEDLEPEAFSAAPSAATVYYLSPASNGMLTSVQQTGAFAVVKTITPTTGVLFPAVALAGYVQVSGDSMTGDLNLGGNDIVDAARVWMGPEADGDFIDNPSGSGLAIATGNVTTTTFPGGAAAVADPVPTQAMRRVDADARYVQVSGDSMTGDLSVTGDVYTIGDGLYLQNDAARTISFEMFNGDNRAQIISNAEGSMTLRTFDDTALLQKSFYFDSATTLLTPNSVLRRIDADDRYIRSSSVSGRSVAGTVGINGGIQFGAGFSVVRVSSGVYEITLDEARSTATFPVIATTRGGGNGRTAQYTSVSTTSFTVYTYAQDGDQLDQSFSFVVY